MSFSQPNLWKKVANESLVGSKRRILNDVNMIFAYRQNPVNKDLTLYPQLASWMAIKDGVH